MVEPLTWLFMELKGVVVKSHRNITIDGLKLFEDHDEDSWSGLTYLDEETGETGTVWDGIDLDSTISDEADDGYDSDEPDWNNYAPAPLN